MLSRRMWSLATPAAGLLAAAAFVSPASAASNTFGCRASVARVSSLSGLPTLEPYVANPSETPCTTGSSGLATGTVNLSALDGLGEVSVGPAEAYTESVNDGSDLGASALTSVSGVSIPTGTAGALTIVGPAQAAASYECENGSVQATASSTLSVVQLGGQTINLPAPGAPDRIQLGGGSYIALNENTTTGTWITEQLVHVHLSGIADVVIGEATVDQPAANACVGITGSGGGGGGSGATGGTGAGGTSPSAGTGTGASDICPVGSTLVPPSGMCEILTAGPGGTTSIPVSAPGANTILGGSVMSLAQARKLYGAKTACLNGAGPRWVVVGTRKSDRITVSKVRMRVMGLGGNDRITVKGGNRTCVNGGAGNDVITNKEKNRVTVFGANGNDHITLGNGPGFVLGGKGNDRIVAGNGRVNLQGNAGKDYIKAGNGRDQLNGGSGNDTLIAGIGKDRLNGGPGNNRLTARGQKAFVQAGKGKSVAYVRKADMKYAKTHGVRTVRRLNH